MQRPDIERLRRSLVTIGTDGSEQFYRRLFALHPALRPLFGADVRGQARLLFEAFDALLNRLDDPSAFQAYADRLGGAHAGYGVRDADYDQLGAAWFMILAERLGREFDPSLERLWLEAYGRIAQAMAGATERERSAGTGSLTTRGKTPP